MSKYSLFHEFIINTISNDIFHSLMILLEYIVCIFPSCFNSTIKIHLFRFNNAYYKKSPNMDPINILTYIHWGYPNDKAYGTLFFLTIFFLIAYYAIIYYLELNKSKPNKKNYFMVAFINFYNIIFFRYFSLVFIDSCISLFILACAFASYTDFMYPVLFMSVLIWYLVTTDNFIDRYCVIMNISNPLLVSGKKHYPFDHMSAQYDTLMLILKVAISIEHNIFKKIIMKCDDNAECVGVNIIAMSCNIFICAIILLVFVRIIIISSWLLFNYSSLYANTGKNNLRKYIVTFTILVTSFNIIGYNIENTYVVQGILIIYSIIIVFSFFCLNYYCKNRSKNNNKHVKLSSSLLLYMLISNNSTALKKKEIKGIQETIFFNHKCNIDCHLCSNYTNNVDTNIAVFAIYLKSISKITDNNYIQKEKENQYRELINLLNYKIQKNVYSFSETYNSMMHKYKNDENYVNNLKFIVNHWLSKNNIHRTHFFGMVFQSSSLKDQVNIVLDDFMKLANETIKNNQDRKSVV